MSDQRERCPDCGCVMHHGRHYGSADLCKRFKALLIERGWRPFKRRSWKFDLAVLNDQLEASAHREAALLREVEQKEIELTRLRFEQVVMIQAERAEMLALREALLAADVSLQNVRPLVLTCAESVVTHDRVYRPLLDQIDSARAKARALLASPAPEVRP